MVAADIGSALVGGAIPAVIALLAFAFGYGRLNQQVGNLAKTVDQIRLDLTRRLDKIEETLVELRERVAKLETAVGRDFPATQ
jgi:hypothetical protein